MFEVHDKLPWKKRLTCAMISTSQKYEKEIKEHDKEIKEYDDELPRKNALPLGEIVDIPMEIENVEKLIKVRKCLDVNE
jgi:hypothetical protein